MMTFYKKKCSCACVCAKKVVPLSRILRFRQYGRQKYTEKNAKKHIN